MENMNPGLGCGSVVWMLAQHVQSATFHPKSHRNQVWWLILVITELKAKGMEIESCEVSLGYLMPYLKKRRRGWECWGVQAVVFPGLCSPMAVRF